MEQSGLITGIILASGFSRRMNSEKLLLTVEGTPVVERVIKAAKNSHLHDVILVFRRDEIKEIGEKYTVKTVCNEKACEGQSAGIKEGIVSAHPDTHGFMFLVADQPYLNSHTINKLIDVFKDGKNNIIVPVYNGKRGNPVIFPAALKEDILQLEGDCGGRTIIDTMMESVKPVDIEESIVGLDFDTQEEYEEIQKSTLNKEHSAKFR